MSEIGRTPMFWMLVFVPGLFAYQRVKPESHTQLFVLSIFAIIPLAGNPFRSGRVMPSAGCSMPHWAI